MFTVKTCQENVEKSTALPPVLHVATGLRTDIKYSHEAWHGAPRGKPIFVPGLPPMAIQTSPEATTGRGAVRSHPTSGLAKRTTTAREGLHPDAWSGGGGVFRGTGMTGVERLPRGISGRGGKVLQPPKTRPATDGERLREVLWPGRFFSHPQQREAGETPLALLPGGWGVAVCHCKYPAGDRSTPSTAPGMRNQYELNPQDQVVNGDACPQESWIGHTLEVGSEMAPHPWFSP